MFDYRRSWRKNSLRDISGLVLAAVFVAAMVLTALQIQFSSRTEFLCFVIPSTAIGLALFAGVAKLLYWDLRLRRDFRFRVTQEFVECECPTPELGDSFRLPFEMIREIRIENEGFDSDRFVILDNSEQEFNISLHFGVPVFRILNTIQAVSPRTTIVEYGRTWEAKPGVVET